MQGTTKSTSNLTAGHINILFLVINALSQVVYECGIPHVLTHM